MACLLNTAVRKTFRSIPFAGIRGRKSVALQPLPES